MSATGDLMSVLRYENVTLNFTRLQNLIDISSNGCVRIGVLFYLNSFGTKMN